MKWRHIALSLIKIYSHREWVGVFFISSNYETFHKCICLREVLLTQSSPLIHNESKPVCAVKSFAFSGTLMGYISTSLSPQCRHILKMLNQQDQVNYWSALKLLSIIEHFAHVKLTYTRMAAANQWLHQYESGSSYTHMQVPLLFFTIQMHIVSDCVAFGLRDKTLHLYLHAYKPCQSLMAERTAIVRNT